MTMKLLGVDASPYARKVRIVLEEKRIPYDYVHAPPSAPDSDVPRHNPLGKVPVLVLESGRAIYDSPVIVEYAEGIAPEPRLIPASFDERIEVRRWEALGDGIADAAVLISHDRREPEEKRKGAEWYQKQRAKIDRALAAMAGDLGEREYCHGAYFTLADIAAGYALAYLDRVCNDIDWRAAHPNLRRLAERLDERASFRKTQPR
jgi:glutathione S-transferase